MAVTLFSDMAYNNIYAFAYWLKIAQFHSFTYIQNIRAKKKAETLPLLQCYSVDFYSLLKPTSVFIRITSWQLCLDNFAQVFRYFTLSWNVNVPIYATRSLDAVIITHYSSHNILITRIFPYQKIPFFPLQEFIFLLYLVWIQNYYMNLNNQL